MKLRRELIYLSIPLLVMLIGCGRSTQSRADRREGDTAASKTATQTAAAVDAASEQGPTRTTTRRIRNPETGRIETRRIPVRPQTGPPEIQPEPVAPDETAATGDRMLTVRVRNPQTGRVETRRVPVEDRDSEPQPRPAAQRAGRQRIDRPDPERADSPAKETAFTVHWQEEASVRVTYSTIYDLLYEQLGLSKVSVKAGGRQVVDALSGRLTAQSAAGATFTISILMESPERCTVAVRATAADLPEAMLEKQTLFLKDRIGAVMADLPEPDQPQPMPYPQTLVLERTMDEVFLAIYDHWADAQGLWKSSQSGDPFYKVIHVRAGSRIEFEFTLRLIDEGKTRLDIAIDHYEGKAEFPLILKTLEAVLEKLQGDEPIALKKTVTR